MIIGIGNDIVSVKRVEKILEEKKEAFLERFFSPEEKEFFREKTVTAEFIAGRWAAKEACAKALGCGFGKECAIKDITILREISEQASGRPLLALSGAGKARSEALGVKRVHLSISHEREYAAAIVILED